MGTGYVFPVLKDHAIETIKKTRKYMNTNINKVERRKENMNGEIKWREERNKY
jgi:prefoldin subunit 5